MSGTATALQGSPLIVFHCAEVALKQCKHEKHWKRGKASDICFKVAGNRHDVIVSGSIGSCI